MKSTLDEQGFEAQQSLRSLQSLQPLFAPALHETPSFSEHDAIQTILSSRASTASGASHRFNGTIGYLSLGLVLSSLLMLSYYWFGRSSERPSTLPPSVSWTGQNTNTTTQALPAASGPFSVALTQHNVTLHTLTQPLHRLDSKPKRSDDTEKDSRASLLNELYLMRHGGTRLSTQGTLSASIKDSSLQLQGMGGLVWTDTLYANHFVLGDASKTIASEFHFAKETMRVRATGSLTDEVILEKLGIHRISRDSVELITWNTLTYPRSFCRFVFSGKSGCIISQQLRDSVPSSSQGQRPNFQPMYIVNADGGIEMFADPAAPKIDVEEVLRLNHEDSLLTLIDGYRTEAQANNMKFCLLMAPASEIATGHRHVEKRIEKFEGTTYLRVDVDWTAQEIITRFEQEMERPNNARMLYKDSCVTVCIHPNGVDPLYLLYYPTKELLDVLPTEVALQVRAEQGNSEALRELRDSYKGCRYMSFCTTSSGSIEDTEILGSLSSDTRVRISLKEPRTLRIALYDIGGRMVSQLDKGTLYPAGSSVVPLRVQSADRSVGFYLLVITSDAGEKVSQRVVLGE